MRVSVVPEARRGAGHALIRISGAAGAGSPRFRIARPGWAEPNLGPSGWQGAEAELEPLDASSEGPDLLLAVGPEVCGWLEEGTFVLSLPAANLSAPIAWPEIEEVHGGSGNTFDVRTAPVVAAADAPVNGAGPPAPVSPPAPAGVVPGAGSSGSVAADAGNTAARNNTRVMAATFSLVALALAGAGGWWWQHRAVQETPATPPTVAEPPVAVPVPTAPMATTSAPAAPSVPAPVPPDLDTLSVADLVGRGNAADMVDQARKRLPTRPQDSLLLLEAAGDDRHDGAAMTELARLYDPGKARQGGIPADARQAAKYYRAASRANDDSGRGERDALRRTLQARRDAGDLTAKLIEQDYWP